MKARKIETIDEFLMRGGKIQMIPTGKSGMDPIAKISKQITLGKKNKKK